MIDVCPEIDDAAEFVAIVSATARRIAEQCTPPEIVVVKIDNWFGQRWLQFSGKALGAVGVANIRLTLPPFVPERVRWQMRYQGPE